MGDSSGVKVEMTPSAPSMSSKDLKKFKDLCEKFPLLESSLKDLTNRVEIAETRLDGHDNSINHTFKAINEKADKTVLGEIKNIHSTIDDIIKQLKQFTPIKADIESNNKRIKSNEKTILSLEDRLDQLKNLLNGKMGDIDKILKKIEEEIEQLTNESNRQGGVIIQINQRIDTLEIKIDNLDKALNGSFLNNPMGLDNNTDISDLKTQISNLKREFLTFKEESFKHDKEVEEELNKKVDKADMIEFERLMRDRMELLEKNIQKAKGDLKKALRIMDDRVKRLTDQVKSRGPSLDREDAVLAKKPLQGWKCATCEKGLTNMIGLPANHYTWNKMPKKDGERIPMMGQGFSRMLMTMNQQHNASASASNFYSPRDDTEDEMTESLHSSRHEKTRQSLSRLEKDGSTTVEASLLPQIKKKKKKNIMNKS